MRHFTPINLIWLAAFLIAVAALALLAEQGARMEAERIEATP